MTAPTEPDAKKRFTPPRPPKDPPVPTTEEPAKPEPQPAAVKREKTWDEFMDSDDPEDFA